jgi:hypothetical protein
MTTINMNTAGFYFGNPSELVGLQLDAWGYGRSVIGGDTNDESTPTGAGTLRWGLVRATWAGSDLIDIAPWNNQITWSGDSGGPVVFRNIIVYFPSSGTSISAPLVVGVNRTSDGMNFADDTLVSSTVPFFNQHLGWFYLRNRDNWGSDRGYVDVQWGSSADGTPVWMWHLVDGSAQHWRYDPSTKAIRNENGKCLDVQWNNSADRTPVWMWPCNGGSAQNWTFNSNSQIVNANGKCLAVDNTLDQSTMMIKTCVASSTQQKWTISATP